MLDDKRRFANVWPWRTQASAQAAGWIGRVNVGGDLFGFLASRIGASKANGEVLSLNTNGPGVPLDDRLVPPTTDVVVREIG